MANQMASHMGGQVSPQAQAAMQQRMMATPNMMNNNNNNVNMQAAMIQMQQQQQQQINANHANQAQYVNNQIRERSTQLYRQMLPNLAAKYNGQENIPADTMNDFKKQVMENARIQVMQQRQQQQRHAQAMLQQQQAMGMNGMMGGQGM
jgi:hypothetical protein